MTGRNFVSDNVAPVHPAVMAAIAEANSGPASSYGEDEISGRLDDIFGRVFEADVRVVPVATGTAANALTLAAMGKPGARFYCHRDAHIAVAEEGAPRFYVAGAECVGIGGEQGRIDPTALKTALSDGRGGILSLTQATERGTVYSPASVAELAGIARDSGLRVQLDGARFANAVAWLDCHPADIAQRAGVDAVVFGTSKNGTLNAEAMVFFDPSFADELFPMRKRSGHAYSKMRYLSAQLEACLAGGLWLELAAHANAMARRLAGASPNARYFLAGAGGGQPDLPRHAGSGAGRASRRGFRNPCGARKRVRSPGDELRDRRGRCRPVDRGGASNLLERSPILLGSPSPGPSRRREGEGRGETASEPPSSRGERVGVRGMPEPHGSRAIVSAR